MHRLTTLACGIFAGCLTATWATGCGNQAPAPTAEPTAEAAPQGPTPPPQVQPGLADKAAGAPPEGDGPKGPPPGTEGGPADPDEHSFRAPDGDRPSFDSLLKDGADTVSVKVSVKGKGSGQIDFAVVEDGAPKVLHVEDFRAGKTVTVTAPAAYDGEIYVSALTSGPPPLASEPKAIVLKGKPLSVSLALKPLGDAPPPALPGVKPGEAPPPKPPQ